MSGVSDDFSALRPFFGRPVHDAASGADEIVWSSIFISRDHDVSNYLGIWARLVQQVTTANRLNLRVLGDSSEDGSIGSVQLHHVSILLLIADPFEFEGLRL